MTHSDATRLEWKHGICHSFASVRPSVDVPCSTRLLFVGLLAVFVMVASPASGKVIQVPKQYATVQEAVAMALDGDVIKVARGTYTINEPINFKGRRVVLESLQGPGVTILDAQSRSRLFDFVTGETSQTVVRGFTIRNGKARGHGGGILCSGGSPTIENCVIRSNKALPQSGGAWQLPNGGGIACEDGAAPTLIGCTVTRNNAGSGGGGLYKSGNGSLRIVDCEFSHNVANSGGGGLLFENVNSGTIEMERCTIQDNRANQWGGGVYASSGSAGQGSFRMDRCLVQDNEADGHGAGVCSLRLDTTITNCLVIGNTGKQSYSDGAALHMFWNTAHIDHCTIVGNEAGHNKQSVSGNNAHLTVTNSILWQNKPVQVGFYGNDQGALDVRYCLVQDGYAGEGNFDGDPIFRNMAGGDYGVKEFSPCINAAQVGSDTAHDYAGDPRPIGRRRDVGAFECEGAGNKAPTIDSFTTATSNSLLYGPPPFEVTFTCQASDNQSGLTYDMQYGDGKRQTAKSGTFTYKYQKVGLYEAKCTVKDRHGALAHAGVTIRVTNSQIPGGYETIQSAINAAQDGDVIALPDGRYTGNHNYDLDFKGKAITLTSVNGPEHCIIDAKHRDRILYFHTGEGADSVVSGLTIMGGLPHNASGGAILCEGASPTIQNCRIIENYAPHTGLGRGGAICCTQNAAPTIKNCYIADNYSGQGGGAIGCWDAGALRIEDCTIRNNMTTNMNGGAIDYVGSRSPKILRCLIENNEAARHGGAISLAGRGATEIRRCIIRNNKATLGAGGAFLGGGVPQPTPVKIVNCIFSGNKAPQGAALEMNLCQVTICNSTLVKNRLLAAGGAAISIVNSSSLVLFNSIVWGTSSGNSLYLGANSALNPDFCAIQGYVAVVAYVLDVDPKFESIGREDYRLKSDSPCRDWGTWSQLSTYSTIDISGAARPQGQGYDMGAYEGSGDLAVVGCSADVAPPPTAPAVALTATPASVAPIEVLLGSIGFHEVWSDFKPGAKVVFDGTVTGNQGEVIVERVTVSLTETSSKESSLTVETADMRKGRPIVTGQLHVTCPAKTKRPASKMQGREELDLKGKVFVCEIHEVTSTDKRSKASSSVLEWRNDTIPGGLAKVELAVTGASGSQGYYQMVSFHK